MGWASGSALAASLIDVICEEVPSNDARRSIYQVLIKEFEDCDCDTLDECLAIDPVFDDVFIERCEND